MLKAMRTGAQSILIKFILFGLLLMAMGGLAMLDVQGMFRRGVTDTTVARIDGDKISTIEFERSVSNTLREKNIPQAVAISLGLPRQVLMNEIDNRMFAKAARDAGILVDDASAAKAVREFLKPLTSGQNLTEKDALNRVLTNTGLSEDAFVGSIKQQAATEELMRLASSGARPPKTMIEDALRYKHETRRADYFKIAAAEAGQVSSPSENELQEYYKTISSRFAQPEYRSFSVLVLDKKSLGISQKTPEDDLRKYYDEHQADYTAPETRVVAQAVVSDENTAKAVFKAASQSKDLQKAATAAKATFIKPQAYTEKDMPVELSPAAFKGQAGEVLAPVKSALGWHVMQIEKVTPGAAKSFDSVKADIEKDLVADKSAEALYEQANKIDDLLAGGKTLEEVAQLYKLTPVAYKQIDSKGNDESGKKADSSLPAFDKVLSQAFRLNKGEASQLIETPSGAFLIVGITDIQPSADQPFEKVRARVLDDWKRKQAGDQIDKLATKIAERIKMGESFEKIAASFGKTPVSTDFVARAADAAKSNFDQGFLPALFSLEKTGDATSIGTTDSVIVLRLSARKIETPKTQDKEESGTVEATLTRALQGDIFDQYRASLMEKYDVTVNDKLVEDMFRQKDKDEENGEGN